MHRWLIIAVCAVLLAIALFGDGLRAPFFNLDDPVNITGNSKITALDWTHLKSIFTPPLGPIHESPEYYPLWQFSFALNYAMDGLNPAVFRATNILLHAGNAVLFAALLTTLGVGLAVALAVAGIFLVHPLSVEPVMWITARKDLLACAFTLLTLLFYLQAGMAKRRSGLYYALSLGSFVCGCLSKGVMVAMLPLLFLLAVYRGKKVNWRMHLARLVPFLLIGGVITVHMVWLRLDSPTYTAMRESGFFFSGVTLLKIFSLNLLLLCWPWSRATYIDVAHATHEPWFLLIVYVSVVALFVWAVVHCWHRQRLAAVGLIGFVLLWLPYANIIPNAILMAERYLYVPMLGILIALAVLLQQQQRRRVFYAFFGSWFLALAIWSGCRATLWKSHEAYWSNVVLHWPLSKVGHFMLGDALKSAKHWDEACREFTTTLQLEPKHPGLLGPTQQNLGVCDAKRGDWQDAAVHFDAALATQRVNQDAYLQAAIVYKQLGDNVAALQRVVSGLRFYPDNAELLRLREQLERRR